MDEKIRTYFDQDVESYNAYTCLSFTIEKERKSWQDLYRTVLGGNDMDILNVGCGPGTEALVLADAGNRVTALDFADNMIAATKANATRFGQEITTVQGDAECLPFEDNSFDAVVSNYALWAIPHPEKAISEWYRVLRPGGTVAFCEVGTPGKVSWFRKKWMRLAWKMRSKDGNGHDRSFDPEVMEHVGALWSKTAVLPDAELEMARAVFPEVTIINKVDKKIFHGRRYIEYGYHKIHYMIVARKH